MSLKIIPGHRHYPLLERWIAPLAKRLLPRRPVLWRFARKRVGWPARLRMVHLSDLHCAAWTTESFVCSVVERSLAERPDLILWTGDFFHSSLGEMRRIMPLFRELHQAVPTYGVLGNHDYDDDVDAIRAILEDCGIRLLCGEVVSLDIGGLRVRLGGIEDYYTMGRPVPAELFPREGCDFRILLSHQPSYVRQLPPNAVDLMLAGHLHGGQVRFPLVGPIYLPQMRGFEFLGKELCVVEGNPVHTSQGLGYTLLPLRFRCPPAISVIEIVPAAETVEAVRECAAEVV
ncbi:Metallophosphoesterase [Sulfidibacter corallicola]|uniref:Metallophosphoesterase n=1 Tax=Sulfidibacter corallicola TaxID=2818388 RepID=A0A8A4U215_SULCO|nr:metallophosphoesterase [Sulfidibacter corallicola]QTD52775.1 metallophosphoesterase [Sulfidibacter corallicola]